LSHELCFQNVVVPNGTKVWQKWSTTAFCFLADVLVYMAWAPSSKEGCVFFGLEESMLWRQTNGQSSRNRSPGSLSAIASSWRQHKNSVFHKSIR